MSAPSDWLVMRFRRTFLTVVLGVASLSGCDSPTEPLPGGAVALDPVPQIFRSWWHDMEICSGRTGDFDAISWYYVPNASAFTVGSKPNVIGYWQPDHRSITLAGMFMTHDYLVRHESLHAILRTAEHPPEYFVEKCGALLSTAPIYTFD